MKRIVPPIVLLALQLGPMVQAATTIPVPTAPDSGISIEVGTPLANRPEFGFLPIRVQVGNRSPEDGEWRIRFIHGSRSVFPGEMEVEHTIAAPAAQNRDEWIYLPLIQAGANAVVPPTTTTPTGLVSSMPPPMEEIFPGPPGVRTNYRITRTEVGQALVDRTFEITQVGPAHLLPPLREPELLGRATVQQSGPDITGMVTRRTTAVVAKAVSASFVGPLDAIVLNARNSLITSGLLGERPSLSTSSVSFAESPVPGMSRLVVTFQAVTPAKPPAPGDLPPGFTYSDPPSLFSYSTTSAGTTINVRSASGALISIQPPAGMTLPTAPGIHVPRTFTYAHDFPSGGLPGGAAIGMIPVASPAAVEETARQKLAAFLSPGPNVVQTIEKIGVPIPQMLAPVPVFLVAQSGPSWALPLPVPAQVPPGAMFNLHRGSAPGEVVRTITFVDETSVANVARVSLAQAFAINPLNLARIALLRRGFLRSHPSIQQTGVLRTPSGVLSVFSGFGTSAATPLAGTPGASAFGGTIVFSETGPARLLPVPESRSLPPEVSVRVTSGPTEGEVVRSFVIPIPGVAGLAVTPLNTGTGPWIEMEISGPGMPVPARIPLSRHLPDGTWANPPLAVSTSLEPALRARITALGGDPHLTPVDLGALPQDWRIWSSFHGLALGAREYVLLEPQYRAVLAGWVAQGGQVFLVPESIEVDLTVNERLGAGAIRTLPGPIDVLLLGDFNELLRFSLPSASLPSASALAKFDASSAFGRREAFAGSSFPWALGLAALFAVVVGPVNLLIAIRRRNRHRFFLTTLGVAGGTVAAIAGLILADQGAGGSGIRTTLVTVVPEQNAAVVYQDQVVRTGFLGSTRFEVDDETILVGIPWGEFSTTSQPARLKRDRQSAEGDWFRSRWHSAHHLRRLVSTRGRVEWAGLSAGGAPIVRSLLNTTLRDFVLMDDAGAPWSAREVRPGESVTLVPAAPDAWSGWRTRHFAGSSYLESVLRVAAPAAPRQWMALGEDSELGPIPTLKSIRWTDSRVLFNGRAIGGGEPLALVP